MKFRWKLLILLLVISIIPVVSLRTFGIQNVRLMADDLISQIKEEQTRDARHRLQLVMEDYSKIIRTSREQAEMALFFQTFEARRILQTTSLPANQGGHSPAPEPNSAGAGKIFGHSSGGRDEMAIGQQEACVSVPTAADAIAVKSAVARLQRMTPICRAVSQYLGNLVLRQYFGLENGLFSVYPCDHEKRPSFESYRQVWYQSAFEEKATAWSRPYVDPASGMTVMAVSNPVLTEKIAELFIFGV
jgi:sigma-B regulation protein RsbU (phosphoserine phosphatase)